LIIDKSLNCKDCNRHYEIFGDYHIVYPRNSEEQITTAAFIYNFSFVIEDWIQQTKYKKRKGWNRHSLLSSIPKKPLPPSLPLPLPLEAKRELGVLASWHNFFNGKGER